MKRINKTSKTVLSLVASATLGLASVASVNAWGPERDTFTMENPATYPTFNSITNNPTIGDERDFVRVGQINADVTQLSDYVDIQPGHQYLVYMYFHNNASSTYNDSAHNHSGIATGTRMSASFPKILNAGEQGTVSGRITANNSNPASVWDEAYLNASSKVYIRYVAGSAKIYNDWQTNNTVVPESLFTEDGTLIGLTSMNGAIPGCEEYHGVISYVIQADSLDGTVEKTVSKDGEAFSEEVSANPGEEVTYKLTIRNVGTKELSNVTIKDTLPAYVSLVPGSVELWANDSNVKTAMPDDLTVNGLNLGTVGTGNVVYVTYRAKINSDVDCGSLTLVNTATMTYDTENITGEINDDSSTVKVTRDDCTPPPVDCSTNPEMEECKTLPNTGPLEIVMAIIVILGIGGGGYYLYRTRRTLKKVETTVKGEPTTENKETPAQEEPKTDK